MGLVRGGLSETVGSDVTLEAPLTAQDILQQRHIDSGIDNADTVERGHYALSAALNKGTLKGTQIRFADSFVRWAKVLRLSRPDS